MKFNQNRRSFIKLATLSSAAAIMPLSSIQANSPMGKRKFRMSINPGAIGVSVNQKELLEAAAKHLSLIHISEPTRPNAPSRMPSSA